MDRVGMIALFLIGMVSALPTDEITDTVQNYQNQPRCLATGGICGLEEYCPEYKRQEKGLCGETLSSQGIECCLGVPENIKNCRQRGGECVPTAQCGRAPRDPLGECPPNHVCCHFE